MKNGIVIAIADFETEYDGERVEIKAGISKMEADHEIARANEALFTTCRGWRTGMRAYSPGSAAAVQPDRARRLDAASLRAEGWDDIAIKSALEDGIIARGPGEGHDRLARAKPARSTPAPRAPLQPLRKRAPRRVTPRKLPR